VYRSDVAPDPPNRLNQLFGRLGLPGLVPAEQLKMMRDLMTTFAPSGAQIDGVRKALEAQRAQLESMVAQLDDLEATLDRLAATAEQVHAMQEPFLRLTRAMFRGDGEDQ
jgi:hypothetical protein